MALMHIGPRNKIEQMKGMISQPNASIPQESISEPEVIDNTVPLLQAQILKLESQLGLQKPIEIIKEVQIEVIREVKVIEEKIIQVPVEKIVHIIKEIPVEIRKIEEKIVEVPVEVIKEIEKLVHKIPTWAYGLLGFETLLIIILLAIKH